MPSRLIRLSLITVVLISSTGRADEAGADLSMPKAAFRTFFRAIVRGDVNAAREAAIAPGKLDEIIVGAAAFASANARLTDAIAVTFPEANMTIGGALKDLDEMLNPLEVRIDGDFATMSSGAGSLRRVGGQWKVDVASLPNGLLHAAGKDKCLEIAKVVDSLTDAVVAKKYPSWNALKIDLAEKMRPYKQSQDPPTSQPDR